MVSPLFTAFALIAAGQRRSAARAGAATSPSARDPRLSPATMRTTDER